MRQRTVMLSSEKQRECYHEASLKHVTHFLHLSPLPEMVSLERGKVKSEKNKKNKTHSSLLQVPRASSLTGNNGGETWTKKQYWMIQSKLQELKVTRVIVSAKMLLRNGKADESSAWQ